MPSLTHVCIWTKHGWERITANEAAKLFPNGTVSAYSKLFMCELCGQYVTLTDSGEKIRYFRHSAYEKSKNCPDRTFGTGSTYEENTSRKYELPIHLSVESSTNFSLSIGFLFVPKDILENQTSKEIRIYPQNSSHSFQYLFERLNSTGITYLPIKDSISLAYRIECAPELRDFWPERITGIDPNGSLFYSDSGNKLTYNSDVKVGEKYYLLRRNRLYSCPSNVKAELLSEKNISFAQWCVYKVEATAYKEDAAKFFLDLHCQLRDRPLKFQMLWPLYEEAPYLIKTNKNDAYVLVRGKRQDISLRSYPWGEYCLQYDRNDSSVVRIRCDQREVLFTAERTDVMQYLYFWKDSLDSETECPCVSVTDRKNEPIEEGMSDKLPEKNRLIIEAPYDGTVIISRGEDIKEKVNFSSKTPLDIKVPGYGSKIEVTQGLDIVWTVVFRKEEKRNSNDEDDILLKTLRSMTGEKISVNHTLGAMEGKLQAYPQTKKWIYKQIRRGEISNQAWKYLRRYVTKNN